MKLVSEKPEQPSKPEKGTGREARIGRRGSRVGIQGKTRSRIDISGKSGMDVAREPRGKKKRYIYMGLAGVALVVVTILLAGLEPAAPTVDRDILLIGTVERGSFVRQVRGPGSLVPEQIVFVSAQTGGRVEAVLVDPGETVTDTSLLVVLSNPDVELEALQAQQQLTVARGRLVELQRILGSLLLQQESAVASAQADWLDAQREAEAYADLVENQTVSRNEASRATERADAQKVAKAIANSLLVKTAIFGNDANWGRIIMAAGNAGVEIDSAVIDIKLGDIIMLEAGTPRAFDEAEAAELLSQKEVDITVDLHMGAESATVLTCDLSYDYVKINAEYRT